MQRNDPGSELPVKTGSDTSIGPTIIMVHDSTVLQDHDYDQNTSDLSHYGEPSEWDEFWKCKDVCAGGNPHNIERLIRFAFSTTRKQQIKMAEANAFRTLMTRCGLNAATATELALYGMSTVTEFAMIPHDDIKDSIIGMLKRPHPNRANGAQVFVGGPALQQLIAVAYWIQLRKLTGRSFTAGECTEAELLGANDRLREIKARKKSREDIDLKKPPKLDNLLKWEKWKDSWETYIGSVYGAADIPLSYVCRKEEDVSITEHQDEYSSAEDRYLRTTVLSGSHYRTDNTRIWTELKEVTQGGPAWEHIRPFEKRKDGRGAFMSLVEQTSSTGSKEARKVKAYDQLSALQYSGPKQRWSFSDYINGHITAHNTLISAEEVPHETKKIRDFLGGIKDERLRNAKEMVGADSSRYPTFDAVQKYLLTVVTNQKGDALRNKTRQVSATGRRDQKSGNKNSGKKSGNSNTGKSKFKGTLEGKTYPKHVYWHIMNAEDREQVNKLRREASTADSGPRKRTVSFAKTDDHAEDDSSPEDEKEAKDAGNQFGRGAHKKQKKSS